MWEAISPNMKSILEALPKGFRSIRDTPCTHPSRLGSPEVPMTSFIEIVQLAAMATAAILASICVVSAIPLGHSRRVSIPNPQRTGFGAIPTTESRPGPSAENLHLEAPVLASNRGKRQSKSTHASPRSGRATPIRTAAASDREPCFSQCREF